MNTRLLARAALFAAITLPAAAPALATVPNGMQNVTPASFQSFNSYADTYTVRGGVVVAHTPALAPAPGTGRQIGLTPASFQSFMADQDRYTTHNGVTTMTPAPGLPPQAPYTMRTASASKYVNINGQHSWVPAQGVTEPEAEDGPDSLKGD